MSESLRRSGTAPPRSSTAPSPLPRRRSLALLGATRGDRSQPRRHLNQEHKTAAERRFGKFVGRNGVFTVITRQRGILRHDEPPDAMNAQQAAATRPRAIPRLSLSKQEAADALGVSIDFFDEHIAHELRMVRRGRRRLIPVRELERWLDRHADGIGAE